MATWNDVIRNPEFEKETWETKNAIRDDFFEKVIRPQAEANGDNPDEVYNDFVSNYNYKPVDLQGPTDIDGMPKVDVGTGVHTESPKQELVPWNEEGLTPPAPTPSTPYQPEEPFREFVQTDDTGTPVAAPKPASTLAPAPTPAPENAPTFKGNPQFSKIATSEKFLSLSPAKKRTVADAYFKQFIAPKVGDTPEQLEKFKKSFGLETIDLSGISPEGTSIATQTKDTLVKLGKWIADAPAEEKGDDLFNIAVDVKNDLVSMGKWIADRPVSGKLTDIKDTGSALWDVGKDIAGFGYDVVAGDDVNAEYGVPVSAEGDDLGVLEEYRYKKAINEAEKQNILNAIKGKGTKPINAADIRLKAEEEATKITREGLIDAATLPFTVAKGVGAVRNFSRAAGAVAAGEATKSAYEGESLGENILPAILIDRALAGVQQAPLVAQSERALDAADTVVKGADIFNQALKESGESLTFDRQLKDAVKGKKLKRETLDALGESSPDLRIIVESANKIARDNDALDTLEFTYREGSWKRADEPEPTFRDDEDVLGFDDETPEFRVDDDGVIEEVKRPEPEPEPKRPASEIDRFVQEFREDAGPMAKKFKDSDIEHWFQLRSGRFNESFDALRGAVQSSLEQRLKDPNVQNYLRARELDEITRSGLVGKVAGVDVSDTLGASTFSKATSFGSKLLDLGVINRIRENLAERVGRQPVEEAVNLFDKLEADTLKRGVKREVSVLDAETKMKNLEAEMQAAQYTPEFGKKRRAWKRAVERYESLLAGEATLKEALKDVSSLKGKQKFDNADVLKAGRAMAYNQSPLAPFIGPDESLTKAVSTLAARGARKARKMPEYEIALRGGAAIQLSTIIGKPLWAVKAAINTANAMAQSGQKQGLLGGLRLVDDFYQKMEKAYRDLDTAYKDLEGAIDYGPEAIQKAEKELERVEKATAKTVKSFEKMYNAIGDNKMKKILRAIAEAERMGQAVQEEE